MVSPCMQRFVVFPFLLNICSLLSGCAPAERANRIQGGAEPGTRIEVSTSSALRIDLYRAGEHEPCFGQPPLTPPHRGTAELNTPPLLPGRYEIRQAGTDLGTLDITPLGACSHTREEILGHLCGWMGRAAARVRLMANRLGPLPDNLASKLTAFETADIELRQILDELKTDDLRRFHRYVENSEALEILDHEPSDAVPLLASTAPATEPLLSTLVVTLDLTATACGYAAGILDALKWGMLGGALLSGGSSALTLPAMEMLSEIAELLRDFIDIALPTDVVAIEPIVPDGPVFVRDRLPVRFRITTHPQTDTVNGALNAVADVFFGPLAREADTLRRQVRQEIRGILSQIGLNLVEDDIAGLRIPEWQFTLDPAAYRIDAWDVAAVLLDGLIDVEELRTVLTAETGAFALLTLFEPIGEVHGGSYDYVLDEMIVEAEGPVTVPITVYSFGQDDSTWIGSILAFFDFDVPLTYEATWSVVAAADHGNTRSTATVIGGGTTPGAFETPGDVDYFRIETTSPGQYVFETTGGTDTYMEIEAASGATLRSDDDSGLDQNASIAYALPARAIIYIRLRHSYSGTGHYELVVTPPGGASGSSGSGGTGSGSGSGSGPDLSPADIEVHDASKSLENYTVEITRVDGDLWGFVDLGYIDLSRPSIGTDDFVLRTKLRATDSLSSGEILFTAGRITVIAGEAIIVRDGYDPTDRRVRPGITTGSWAFELSATSGGTATVLVEGRRAFVGWIDLGEVTLRISPH